MAKAHLALYLEIPEGFGLYDIVAVEQMLTSNSANRYWSIVVKLKFRELIKDFEQ